MGVPIFTIDGLLPPGDYPLTFSELRGSFLVTGEGCSHSWDRTWRSTLVDNLEILVKQLWIVGLNKVFIDGSFVEDKDHPNDIDGYFECDLRYYVSGKLVKDLNLLDPNKVWTWNPASLKGVSNFAKMQLPMWLVYRVELYPQCVQMTGIKDRYGNDLPFASAFRQRREDGKQKGIILLVDGDKI